MKFINSRPCYCLLYYDIYSTIRSLVPFHSVPNFKNVSSCVLKATEEQTKRTNKKFSEWKQCERGNCSQTINDEIYLGRFLPRSRWREYCSWTRHREKGTDVEGQIKRGSLTSQTCIDVYLFETIPTWTDTLVTIFGKFVKFLIIDAKFCSTYIWSKGILDGNIDYCVQ